MSVAAEDDSETTKPNREQVRSSIMATSEVDLKWILFIIIIAKDDNDDNNKDMKPWNESGNAWYGGWYGYKINKCYEGFMFDWGLVFDDIDIGCVGEGIMGATAAPDGVAITIIFVYWEGGVCGIVLIFIWEYLEDILVCLDRMNVW